MHEIPRPILDPILAYQAAGEVRLYNWLFNVVADLLIIRFLYPKQFAIFTITRVLFNVDGVSLSRSSRERVTAVGGAFGCRVHPGIKTLPWSRFCRSHRSFPYLRCRWSASRLVLVGQSTNLSIDWSSLYWPNALSHRLHDIRSK